MKESLMAVAFCLAFLGGYADAASYVLTTSFTGHVTGNTVLLAIHLVQADWMAAVTNILAVMAFLFGTAGAEWMEEGTDASKSAGALRTPLLIEALFLLAAAGCHREYGWWGDDPSIVLLCLGLGWQNGALRKCGVASIHTTFITGLSTWVVKDAVNRSSDHPDHENARKHPVGLLAGVLVVFVAGAVVGGFLSLRCSEWVLPGTLVPLASAWIATCCHPDVDEGGAERD